MNSSALDAAQFGSATPRNPETSAPVLVDETDVGRKHKAQTPVHKDEMRKAAFLIASEVRHVERIMEHENWSLTLYDSAVADLLDAANRLRKIAKKVRESYVPPEDVVRRGGW